MEKKLHLTLGTLSTLYSKLEKVEGVKSVTKGFVNGTTAFPLLKDVKNGSSGHRYCLRISFDDSIVSLEDLLNVFVTEALVYLAKKQLKEQERHALYYTDLLDAIAFNEFLHQTMDDPSLVKIEKLNNFFIYKA